MKNRINKIAMVFLTLCLTTIYSRAFAKNIVTGKITKGHSSVQYTVDTDTGIYSLNFSDAFRFKLAVNALEMDKVSCEKEKAIVKDLAGRLRSKSYRMGRKPVKLSIVSSDLNLDLNQVEKEIQLNLNSRGYKVSNLKSTTKFFITKLDPIFEWGEDSLTKNAKAGLSEEATEIFLSSIKKNPDEYENLHLVGRLNMEMPLHTVMCDLLDGDLKIYFNAFIKVVNDNIQGPALSKNQLLALNSEILNYSEMLKKASSNEDKNFDMGTKKIIHSAAALAFGLAKQGFGLSFLKHDYFESIFYKMFNSSTMDPKKLSNSDLHDLENELSEETRTQDDPVVFSNKELKFEVIK